MNNSFSRVRSKLTYKPMNTLNKQMKDNYIKDSLTKQEEIYDASV